MKSINDLIIGNCYAAIITSSGGRYIFFYEGGELKNNLPPYMFWVDYTKAGSGGSLNVPENKGFSHYEPATNDEAMHLRQCINVGKYVPYSKPKHDSYEIY